jgi:hypothetical protein
MKTEYLDFELELGENDRAQGWPVAVVHSPAGNVRGRLTLPDDLRKITMNAHALDRADATAFGALLFERLFIETGIYPTYRESLGMADAHGKSLRIKLRIVDPALTAIPWELLYEARRGEFLVLAQQTPLVRYIEAAQPLQPLRITLPLRILGVAVDPTGVLDLEKEKAVVATAIAPLVRNGASALTWLNGGTWRELQQALRGGGAPWHIFHFIGHGGYDEAANEGFLLFADETGEVAPLSATELGRLLASQPSLRLALINACHGAISVPAAPQSSIAGSLIRRGVPAVIAMQSALADRAAIELSHTFYESLSGGLPLEASLTEARIAVSLIARDRTDWAAPVAFLRAPDGVLFSMTGGISIETSPPAHPSSEGAAGGAPGSVPDSLPELTEAFSRNEVVPLLGSDFAVSAGLPDWYTLVSALADRSGQPMPPPEWATKEALTSIVQTYVNQRGLNNLISYLKDRLSTIGVTPTAAHKALAELPVDLILTITLDDLLERALREAGRRVEIVVRDSDIPLMRRGSGIVHIVKVYGDLSQPDMLVFARQQQERFALERPQLLKLIETEMSRSTMLYLGWGRNEPLFGLNLGEMVARYGSMARMGYVVVRELSPTQTDEWRRLHIQPVLLPDGTSEAERLASWMRAIRSSIPR